MLLKNSFIVFRIITLLDSSKVNFFKECRNAGWLHARALCLFTLLYDFLFYVIICAALYDF